MALIKHIARIKSLFPEQMVVNMPIFADTQRSLRDVPSTRYTMVIESFSDLQKILKETELKSYESDTFKAGGFKWKLSLYPNGDEERNGKGHISMYLLFAERTSTMDVSFLGSGVFASFKIFIYDQRNHKLLEQKQGKWLFNGGKIKWGFARLITQTAFHDTSNGFLVHDKCVFGVEISVFSLGNSGEHLRPMRNVNCLYTWKINQFSSLKEDFHYSETFILADLKWNLLLYPKGHSHGVDKYLSIFLCLQESNTPVRVYADMKLSIMDQLNNNHWSIAGLHVFSEESRGSGWPCHLSLRKIGDNSRGFVVNDTMIIEVNIMKLSTLESNFNL